MSPTPSNRKIGVVAACILAGLGGDLNQAWRLLRRQDIATHKPTIGRLQVNVGDIERLRGTAFTNEQIDEAEMAQAEHYRERSAANRARRLARMQGEARL